MFVVGDGHSYQLGLPRPDVDGPNARPFKRFPFRVNACAGSEPKLVNAGTFNSMVIDEEGNLWACGDNGRGQIGLPNDVLEGGVSDSAVAVFTRVPLPVTVVAVQNGDAYSMALTDTGSLWMAGTFEDGNHRSLGLTSASPDPVEHFMLIYTPPSPEERITQIAGGPNHAVVRLANGRALSCGYAHNGVLGRNAADAEMDIMEVEDAARRQELLDTFLTFRTVEGLDNVSIQHVGAVRVRLQASVGGPCRMDG